MPPTISTHRVVDPLIAELADRLRQYNRRASEVVPGPLPVAPPLGKLPPEVRGRDGLIGELRRALRPYPWRASRAFVIAGLGGLGKSTVALTAARMARQRGYRVWWVHTATRRG